MQRTVLLCVATALGACSAHRSPAAMAEAPAQPMAEGSASYPLDAMQAEVESAPAPSVQAEADSAPAPSARAAAQGAPVARSRSPSAQPGRPSNGAAGRPDATPTEAPKARMVYYNAYAKLRVSTPSETLAAAQRIAEDAGGHVEQRTLQFITLRIPVEKFRSALDALLALGQVLERSVNAQDVTEAYRAADLRLRVLSASRDRLLALLAKAKDENEKLTLLREIQRLTDELEQLRMQVNVLANLAAFSRVTLAVEPPPSAPAPVVEDLGAFRWMARLSPFIRDFAREGHDLELPAPKGMVALEGEPWSAESADGAALWTSRHDNEPVGSTDFWLTALAARLGPQYGEAQLGKVGSFGMLRLVAPANGGYRYTIYVRAEGEALDVVEVFYPTAAHEERFGEAVRAVLAAGGAV